MLSQCICCNFTSSSSSNFFPPQGDCQPTNIKQYPKVSPSALSRLSHPANCSAEGVLSAAVTQVPTLWLINCLASRSYCDLCSLCWQLGRCPSRVWSAAPCKCADESSITNVKYQKYSKNILLSAAMVTTNSNPSPATLKPGCPESSQLCRR